MQSNSFIKRAKEQLSSPQEKQGDFQPVQQFSKRGSPEDKERGERLMANGKCACLVVAGGQGSRLRFEQPKGCFPISAVKHKSFFQITAERVAAASAKVGLDLEVAIMTSPLNDAETRQFFLKHDRFGLKEGQLHFFSQEMWPLLDLEGAPFLEGPERNAEGPNGNGSALRLLAESSFFQKWKERGIEFVNFILIDNALALPFDAELFGFHARNQADVTVKAAKRLHSEESVGILVQSEGHLSVVEYSEFPLDQKRAKEDQELKYPLANLSLFCFSTAFIEKVANEQLPLHRMKKAVKKLTTTGAVEFPKEPNAWKFEEYIFDVLQFSDRTAVLVYPREECFAPLKSLEGEHGLEAVRKALQNYDQRVLFSLTGQWRDLPLELDPAFHYPTTAVIDKWREAKLPSSQYIEV